MVTQYYYWASHGNPVALLGDAFATEELGVALGLEAAQVVEATLDIPREATNFLQVHGSEDAAHLNAAAQAIEWYADTLCHEDDLQELWTAIHRRFGVG